MSGEAPTPNALARSLSPTPDAAAEARRLMQGLAPYVDDGLLERITIATSELVTNSLKHSGAEPPQTIDVGATVGDASICVEVIDPGPGFDGETEPGWGLWLIDRLADRWDVERAASTRVWCEFDR
jgi:anti-sigma regulatory factor (Ser/Thr protein kinase)